MGRRLASKGSHAPLGTTANLGAARAAPAGTPVGGTQTRGASGGAESQSSESSHRLRDSRAARESRALRDSDARSSPPGNLYSADEKASSASSEDSP